ncbi:MAG: class I SAM-dependent methyltransferase [Actinobacteria bacterium]|nr:class I SAM-dependent methyltransferase [Actinomycetota bacterium]
MLKIGAYAYDRIMSGVEEAGLTSWRRDLLTSLAGEVIEIGAGTGSNLSLYPADVKGLVLSEPDAHMRSRLSKAVASRRKAISQQGGSTTIDVIDAPCEQLPFPEGTFDAAVVTLVLCSVRDPILALKEIYRVLKPGGRLVYLEHVAALDRPRRLRWQQLVEPVWKRMAGNCHLTRVTEDSIVSSGFQIVELERASMRKAPPIVRPTIRGVAFRP